MSDYKQKYLKYKNKYIELKKMSGGTLQEIYDTKVQECDARAAQNIIDARQCGNCPFNNAGANHLPNRCKSITGNANYCFTNADNNGLNERMNIQKYYEGLSNITIENNIHVTPPEGEVCFGNTITSCLTYCVILNDNTKISVHVNPFTNANTIIHKFEQVIANESVNIFNAHIRILDILNQLNTLAPRRIQKVLIVSELYPFVCYTDNEENQFIGTTDILHDNVISGYLDQETYEEKPIDVFLREVWQNYMTPETEVIIKRNILIHQGSIYMVDAEGVGKIFDSRNNLIEQF